MHVLLHNLCDLEVITKEEPLSRARSFMIEWVKLNPGFLSPNLAGWPAWRGEGGRLDVGNVGR